MQKIPLYFIIIAICLSFSFLSAMEKKSTGLDRIKIRALLNDKEQAPNRVALRKRFSTVLPRVPVVKLTQKKRLNMSEVTASMKRLTQEICPAGIVQKPVYFHNFNPIDASKKGSLPERVRILATPAQTNDANSLN